MGLGMGRKSKASASLTKLRMKEEDGTEACQLSSKRATMAHQSKEQIHGFQRVAISEVAFISDPDTPVFEYIRLTTMCVLSTTHVPPPNRA